MTLRWRHGTAQRLGYEPLAGQFRGDGSVGRRPADLLTQGTSCVLADRKRVERLTPYAGSHAEPAVMMHSPRCCRVNAAIPEHDVGRIGQRALMGGRRQAAAGVAESEDVVR